MEETDSKIAKLKNELECIKKRQARREAARKRDGARTWQIEHELRRLELQKLIGVPGAVKYAFSIEGKYSQLSGQPATLCEMRKTRCVLKYEDGSEKGFRYDVSLYNVTKVGDPMGMFIPFK